MVVRRMDEERIVILSPHLDDAVLSCWHLFESSRRVRVINVFTGLPIRNGAAWWDRMTGSNDSGRRMEERLAEDRDAHARTGAEAENLPLLDEQYRNGDAPAGLVERIAAALEGERSIYAPAAMGFGSRDHELVRAAAQRLCEEPDLDLHLYADLPHAIAFGWPSWVTGEPARCDPAAWWEDRLASQGEPDRLHAQVHRLAPDARQRKLDATMSYRTQLPALDLMCRGVTRSDWLAYEVTWSLGERVELRGTPRSGG
jgi:LmbE family N-acetylglucosaminyl deacetylase